MSSLDTAKHCWGDALPDWVEILAKEADKTSQAKVAKKIEYSPAAVNLVLKNTYKGLLSNVEKKVRTHLMDSEHQCPVLGTILIRDCLTYQSQQFTSSMTPDKLRLYRACQNCKHNTNKQEN